MSSSLKVIDWERRGNVVRFISGRRELEAWWGDDWNDAPYEHNAGTVYEDKFAHGFREVAFGFDVRLTEPCDGHDNSPWCKDDMRDRKVPILAVVRTDSWAEDFDSLRAQEGAIEVYMGDDWLSLNDLPGVVVRSVG